METPDKHTPAEKSKEKKGEKQSGNYALAAATIIAALAPFAYSILHISPSPPAPAPTPIAASGTPITPDWSPLCDWGPLAGPDLRILGLEVKTRDNKPVLEARIQATNGLHAQGAGFSPIVFHVLGEEGSDILSPQTLEIGVLPTEAKKTLRFELPAGYPAKARQIRVEAN